MADIVKYGTPTLSTVVPPTTSRLPGLVAGEALGAGDVVYIKQADGRLYKAVSEATEKRFAVGLAGEDASIGQAVTILRNVTIGYSNGLLLPGLKVFVSVTAGLIADATSASAPTPIGFALDTKRIHFHFNASS